MAAPSFDAETFATPLGPIKRWVSSQSIAAMANIGRTVGPKSSQDDLKSALMCLASLAQAKRSFDDWADALVVVARATDLGPRIDNPAPGSSVSSPPSPTSVNDGVVAKVQELRHQLDRLSVQTSALKAASLNVNRDRYIVNARRYLVFLNQNRLARSWSVLLRTPSIVMKWNRLMAGDPMAATIAVDAAKSAVDIYDVAAGNLFMPGTSTAAHASYEQRTKELLTRALTAEMFGLSLAAFDARTPVTVDVIKSAAVEKISAGFAVDLARLAEQSTAIVKN